MTLLIDNYFIRLASPKHKKGKKADATTDDDDDGQVVRDEGEGAHAAPAPAPSPIPISHSARPRFSNTKKRLGLRVLKNLQGKN